MWARVRNLVVDDDDDTASNASSLNRRGSRRRKKPRFDRKKTKTLDAEERPKLSLAPAKPLIPPNRLGFVDPAPSIQKAVRYRNITTPRKKTYNGYRKYSLCHFPLEHFGNYSVGVMLYFKSLRRFAITLCIASLLMLPVAVLHMRAEATNVTERQVVTGFERSMLGNVFFDLPPLKKEQIGDDLTTVSIASVEPGVALSKEMYGALVASLDACVCIMLLIACFRR
jgi:hypothetical protein